MRRKKGYYSISAVAQMFSVHQQTIRLYEKQGLVTPKRSEGNTRLFSEDDIDKLEEIIYLTHKLGVNIAGVEMILKLQKKMGKLQRQVNDLFVELHGNLEEESKTYKKDIKDHVAHLRRLKDQKGQKAIDVQEGGGETPSQHSEKESEDEWEIDYEG